MTGAARAGGEMLPLWATVGLAVVVAVGVFLVLRAIRAAGTRSMLEEMRRARRRRDRS